MPGVLLDSLGHAVIATDLDGVVSYWNSAAERLYGWTAAEAVGRNIMTLTVPEVSQQAAAEIRAALKAGIPWSGGFPVRHKDGTIFPVLVTGTHIYRDGALTGIIGVSTNLGTALRPLLQRSSDAALVLRRDGVITFASSAVNQLFGWSAEALVGTSMTPLVHPEDRSAFAEFMTQVLARPGPYAPLDLRVHRGPDWVWAEAALTNLLDDPVVRGVVCNLRLNVRRAAQEAAETRAEQLQAALVSRLIIERAKGYLIARQAISADTAFDLLRRYARAHNRRIRDVAHDVTQGVLDLPAAQAVKDVAQPRSALTSSGRSASSPPKLGRG